MICCYPVSIRGVPEHVKKRLTYLQVQQRRAGGQRCDFDYERSETADVHIFNRLLLNRQRNSGAVALDLQIEQSGVEIDTTDRHVRLQGAVDRQQGRVTESEVCAQRLADVDLRIFIEDDDILLPAERQKSRPGARDPAGADDDLTSGYKSHQ